MKKTILYAVVLVVVLASLVGVLVWQKKTTQNVLQNQVETTENIDTNTIDTSDWKTYRNEEIGIQFDYPSSWGDINLSKEVGCVDYYATEVVIPKDVKESCLHVTLSASNFNKGAFLSTEGIDYTNTEIPRGADWRFRLLSLPKEQEDFCLNNPFILVSNKWGRLEDCEKFETASGLPVVKGVRGIPFTENEKMTVYFIRTNHPVYYDLVLSSQYLNSSTTEGELRQLIETIQLQQM